VGTGTCSSRIGSPILWSLAASIVVTRGPPLRERQAAGPATALRSIWSCTARACVPADEAAAHNWTGVTAGVYMQTDRPVGKELCADGPGLSPCSSLGRERFFRHANKAAGDRPGRGSG